LTEIADKEFITYLLDELIIKSEELVGEIFNMLSELEIGNSNLYDGEYFYLNECFYNNIEVFPFESETYEYILYLIEILKEVQSTNSSKVLIRILETMINIENKSKLEVDVTEKVTRNIKGMGKNIHHGIRVLWDVFRQFRCTLDDIRDCVSNEIKCDIIESYSNKDSGIVYDLLRGHSVDLSSIIIQEDASSYILVYLIIKGKLADHRLSKMILNLENLRVRELVLRNMDQFSIDGNYLARLDLSYHTNKSVENVIKYASTLEDTLNNESNLKIVSMEGDVQMEGMDYNMSSLIDLIGSDQVAWVLSSPFYEKRVDIYNDLLDSISKKLSSMIMNNYNLSRVERDTRDEIVFALMTDSFNFNERVESGGSYAWILLLRSVKHIRNINILFFIEGMIKKSTDWMGFLSKNRERPLFAYNFPTLMTIFYEKTKLLPNMTDLIMEESRVNIDGVDKKLLKVTSGWILKVEYKSGEISISAKIEIPENYPIGRTMFTTSTMDKDMLTRKMNVLLRTCSKFSEIISLWKVNLDRRMEGLKECPICYFVVELGDKSFPDYSCKTCFNKFHYRCLARWFRESNANTSPICRRVISIIK
jgi:hypothetical protein